MSTLRVIAEFIRRDFRILTSYRLSFVLQMSTIFFFLALYYFLSKIVDEEQFAASQDINADYFSYAAVGLALLSILQVGLSSFSQKMREEQTTGTFEALMATPTSPSLLVLASAVYDLLRSTAFAFVLLTTAVILFGLQLDTDPASLAVAAVALIGCLGLFASLGVAGAADGDFKQTAALAGMVVSGLALLSGCIPDRRAARGPPEGRRDHPVHLGPRRGARRAGGTVEHRAACGAVRLGRRPPAIRCARIHEFGAEGAQDRHARPVLTVSPSQAKRGLTLA